MLNSIKRRVDLDKYKESERFVGSLRVKRAGEREREREKEKRERERERELEHISERERVVRVEVIKNENGNGNFCKGGLTRNRLTETL